MGQAVDVIDNENARKRSDKALRGHGYTGNLVAFTRPATGGSSQGRTAVARFKAMQPSQTPHYTYVEEHDSLDTSPHIGDHATASNDPSKGQFTLKTLPLQKKAMAAAVVGSLTVGAILGGVWLMSKPQPSTISDSENLASGADAAPAPVSSNTASKIEPSTVQNVAATLPQATNAANLTTGGTVPATSATTSSPNGVVAPSNTNTVTVNPTPVNYVTTQSENAALGEIATTRALKNQIAGYQEEIDWLNDQNLVLTQQVELLTIETLELNQELLELELELAKLANPANVKTVYNFVNVPIGDGEVSNTYETYSEPVVYEPNNSYPEPEPNVYPDDFRYSENEEYRDLYGYPESEEPIYDPETGLYLSPDMIGNAGRQYIEEGVQVIYPPVATESY